MDLRIAGVTRPAAVGFSFAGRALSAPAGENLAAALLACGVRSFGAPCLMGVCQVCLVRVDGRLSQACKIPVRAGMQVTAA